MPRGPDGSFPIIDAATEVLTTKGVDFDLVHGLRVVLDRLCVMAPGTSMKTTISCSRCHEGKVESQTLRQGGQTGVWRSFKEWKHFDVDVITKSDGEPRVRRATAAPAEERAWSRLGQRDAGPTEASSSIRVGRVQLRTSTDWPAHVQCCFSRACAVSASVVIVVL